MQESEPARAGTRRDRRIQKRRQEILTAATRIFARKGFANATTKDIANEADIGESTLYNYFDSKRDILVAIIEEQHSLFDAMVHQASGLASREALVDLVDKSLDLFTSRMAFIRTILSEAWVDDDILEHYVMARLQQISQVIQGFVVDQAKAGVVRPIDPALVARLILGMFFSLVLPALRGVEPPPPPQQRRALAETMISLLLDGIRTRDEASSV